MPNQKKLLTELETLDDDLKAVRDKIANSTDAVCIGRAAALLYIDPLVRLRGFSRQVDAALGSDLLIEGLPLKENVARAATLLRVHARLWKMQDDAIKGMLICLGIIDTARRK